MAGKGKAYYKGKGFEFDLPGGWNLLAMAEPNDRVCMADIGARVRELLAKPFGMPSLDEVVKGLPHTKTVIIKACLKMEKNSIPFPPYWVVVIKS